MTTTVPGEKAMTTPHVLSVGVEFVLYPDDGGMGVQLPPDLARELGGGVYPVGDELDELTARGWVEEVAEPAPGVVVTGRGHYWLGRWLKAREGRRPRLAAPMARRTRS